MKILAVDDEPIFVEILEVALGELGYNDVTPAFSAQAALREIEHSKDTFDCILLDIRMPGTDGVQLCRMIRSMPKYNRVPIMMVTSMSDRSYIDAAFNAGATDYLNKPLDVVELKARMAMLARLVQEQLRTSLLEYRAAAADGMVELQFDLSTKLVIPGYDRLIEYLALENYLLSLGLRESYTASAFAISIQNAATIYSAATPVAFMNMLGDVSSCIEDALKSTSALIAYAGNGNFVAVLTGEQGRVDQSAIQDAINIGLEGFSGIYLADRIPTPDVAVGAMVRKTLFSRLRNGDDLLLRAIAAVEHHPIAMPARKWA
ncbi:response regulator [Gemmobacter serpentinus]|uniref:response regulator n=1 Tax=Gemmobacter serpentinus TaxID=2652247 RepID=UPI00124DB9E3|nr:response regulator [Gemmobacter serpentinus]